MKSDNIVNSLVFSDPSKENLEFKRVVRLRRVDSKLNNKMKSSKVGYAFLKVY